MTTTTNVCKLCRREGVKLFLKGQRCFSEKCGVNRRNYPPGQHVRPKKGTDYGTQLRPAFASSSVWKPSRSVSVIARRM